MIMNKSEVRSLFKYLGTGRIYFNHASTGPLSNRVLDEINERLVISSEGVIDDFQSFINVAAETKNLLAQILNSDPDSIAFIDNTTNGINLLAQGIKWIKGDRIVLNDIEFPANVYPFMNLQEQGVEIDFVKSKNGAVSADDIIETVKPNTKLISISFVQFLTGYKADMNKLGKFCKENNIIFSVDAIQGLGAFNMDVVKDNIDFISCGSQKWLMGLQGLAFVYVSEKLRNELAPKYVGWLSVENAWSLLDFDLRLKKSAEQYQTGTVNTIGIYALNASLKLFKEYGYENVTKDVIDNTRYLIKRLQDINAEFVCNAVEEKYLSGIVSIRHKDFDALFKYLNENKVSTAVRDGILRFSPHFYNNFEEIDKVIDLMKKFTH